MTFKDGTIAVLLVLLIVGGALAASEWGKKRELKGLVKASEVALTAETARADTQTAKADEALEAAIRADSRMLAATAKSDSLEKELKSDVDEAVEVSVEIGESIDEWLGSLRMVLIQLETPHETIELVDSIAGAVDDLGSQVVAAADAFKIKGSEFLNYRQKAVAFSDSAKIRFAASDSTFAAKDSVISLQAGQIETYRKLANPGVLDRMKRMIPFTSVESTVNVVITVLVLILK